MGISLATLVILVVVFLFAGPIGLEDFFDKVANRLGLQSHRKTGDEYLGKECVVVKQDGGDIRVQLNDTTWSASLSNPNERVELGDRVLIDKVESTRFWISKSSG